MLGVKCDGRFQAVTGDVAGQEHAFDDRTQGVRCNGRDVEKSAWCAGDPDSVDANRCEIPDVSRSMESETVDLDAAPSIVDDDVNVVVDLTCPSPPKFCCCRMRNNSCGGCEEGTCCDPLKTTRCVSEER